MRNKIILMSLIKKKKGTKLTTLVLIILLEKGVSTMLNCVVRRIRSGFG